MIRLKRVYEEPGLKDGYRMLVDRLWPRGLKKEDVRIDAWLKELAPSAELRKWFAHDPARWPEFRRRYAAELERKAEALSSLARRAHEGTLTLLFAAKDDRRNNAVVLKACLEALARPKRRKARAKTRQRRSAG